MAAPAPLLAADVPWLLYRSYFALPKSIADGEGHPVNALLGTVNALLNVLDGRLSAQGPRCVVACMGAEEAKYRVALYPGYHAQRDPMPAELRRQWERAPQLLRSLGWTYATSETLEADDVMFSYALAEQAAGGRALLMSGDRDMYGAVSERVAVLELLKGGKSAELGPAQVRERYGIEPQQVPDLIALRGDPSDGLPGAPGVGAKGAAELLREHGTLERVLEAARELENRVAREPGALRPRIAATLRENEQLLLDFKQIATLQQIELERPPDAVTDFAAGAACAREMGMRRLAERLEKLATA
jgi:5'-3' exonuclease